MREDPFDQAERWLDLINYLHVSPGARAAELASRYGCTVRTIQRDMNDLRSLGLPIESHDGYRLSREAFLPPLNLSAAEVLAMLVGTRFAQRFGGEEVARAADSAFTKLCRGARPSQRRVARRVPVEVGERPGTYSGAELLPRLSEVVADKGRLRMLYHSLNQDQPRWRTVYPLSLFFFDSAWYMQAYDEGHREERTFRLSRIRELECASSAEPPPGGSGEPPPRHRWDFMGGEEVEVRLRVAPTLGRWLEENPAHPSQRLEEGLAIYQVRNPLKMTLWMLSLDGAEVLSPDWVRAAVEERARALCLLHSNQ